jgi:molecular chaperone IbpA
MRSFDFAPFSRSTIGFDRMFGILQDALRSSEADPGYPPYNIKKTGDDAYCLVLVVAGFKPEQLTVTAERDVLTVRGQLPAPDSMRYLHQGISAGPFERRFSLADYIKVIGARLSDGILSIDLVREVPEAVRPKRVPIAAGAKAIEQKAA